MAGVRASCFIAVDRFGAEALGQYLALLQEAGNADLIYQSRFLWAGIGDRPTTENYWEFSVPEWTFDDPVDEPFAWSSEDNPAPDPIVGLATSDAPLLRHVNECVRENGRLRWLIDEYLPAEFGHAELDAVNLILVGSLASRGTHSVVQGFLNGNKELRQNPFSIDPQEYVIAGIGHLTADDAGDDHARARAGSALLELQKHFESTDPIRAAAMTCVVNEQVDAEEGAVLDRQSQVMIAASVALGLGEDAGKSPDDGAHHVFRMKKRPLTQKVEWCHPDSVVTRDKLFAYCGGGAVHYRAALLHRILATRLIEGACDLFVQHDPDEREVTPDTSGINPDVLEQLHQQITDSANDALRDRDLTGEEPLEPWSFSGAEEIVNHVFDKVWNDALSAFNEQIFENLPLEDWDQTLEDLSTFVATGLVSRIDMDRVELKKQVILSLDEGLEAGFEEICRNSWTEETEFAPRAHCLLTLRNLRDRIDAALVECDAQQRAGRLEQSEIDYFRNEIPPARERINKIMDEIPSPQALVLRAGGTLSAFMLLGLAVPWDLGLLDPWFLRIGLGLIPAAGLLGRAWYKMVTAKRELMEALREWIARQRHYYEEQQREARFDTIQLVLLEWRRYLEWLLAKDQAEEGRFELDEDPVWAEKASTEFAGRRKAFLHRFSAAMEAARDRWGSLRKEIISALRSAKNVVYLPAVRRGEIDFAGLPEPPPEEYLQKTTPETLRREFANIQVAFDAETEPTDAWLLGKATDVHAMWFEDAIVPDAECLVDPAVRTGNPAFQLLELVAEQLGRTWTVSLSTILEGRIKQQQSRGETPDFVVHMNKNMKVVWFNELFHRVTFATGAADALARTMQAAEEMIISPEYHCFLNVALPLSGSEIVYIGGKEQPRTFLGQATKAALSGDQREN